VEDLDLAPAGPGQVVVKIAASGVCHTDYSYQTGALGGALPVVLGHEGAGVVEAVGPGVTAVAPGDPVVLSWTPYCGRCFYCSRGFPALCDARSTTLASTPPALGTLRQAGGGLPVAPMATLGTFAERAMVAESSCIKLDPGVPLEQACLIGCAVMTGTGAAINTARVAPGSSAVVFGCGGIGLNVVQGCRLAGAATIIAVDVLDPKLALARDFGATHTLNAAKEDVAAAVLDLSGGRGVDYAFEAIGNVRTMEQAVASTHRAGTTVLVGSAARGAAMTLPYAGFFSERTVKGCVYGSSRPHLDIPRLVDLYRKGRLKVAELVTQTYPLDAVNEAMAALARGDGARGVIVM
jgi:S-(hydroxymethyl)glutathione dehydrogenase/alcohol dehydrogenase